MSAIASEAGVQTRRDNRETVSSYERCADDYAQSTRGEPSEIQSQLLQAFIQSVGRSARVLEVGSGPDGMPIDAG